MTPAATLLRKIRENRRFQQKNGAYRLGKLQTYLNAIETGKRNVNWAKFKGSVISGYQLTDTEIDDLHEAIKYSKNKITFSLTMPESRYRLVHIFCSCLEDLNQREINKIWSILARKELCINDCRIKQDARNALLAVAKKKRANGN